MGNNKQLSSFQLSVESISHFILLCSVIGLKNSCHFLIQWETKPIVFSPHAFSRAWRQLHVFASNSDWFIALFMSVVISPNNYFGFGFMTLPHYEGEAKCKTFHLVLFAYE